MFTLNWQLGGYCLSDVLCHRLILSTRAHFQRNFLALPHSPLYTICHRINVLREISFLPLNPHFPFNLQTPQYSGIEGCKRVPSLFFLYLRHERCLFKWTSREISERMSTCNGNVKPQRCIVTDEGDSALYTVWKATNGRSQVEHRKDLFE